MRAGVLSRRIGAADGAGYLELVDALAPQRHWRFDEASGTLAVDRIAGHDATLVNAPIRNIDPLVRNGAGGRSIGLKGGLVPAHVTIEDLVTSAAFTLDLALQVDDHPGAGGKYVIVTTGGGSMPGEVSVELEDDGVFGLRVRCWSVDDGGVPIIRHSGPGTVPIGRAFKLSYRRDGDGTQSILIDGAAQALAVESGGDPASWSATPSTTWYVGVWPTLTGAFKGLIAELVAWQGAVSDVALLSLARPRNVVWLGDFDAGSVGEGATRTIDTASHVFPTTGLIAVKDADGSLGSVTSHGAAFDYIAGDTAGADSFLGHVDRGGTSSRVATIGVTVAAGQVKDGTPTDDAVPAGFVSPVEDHGAAGDGAADDTAELQAALGGSTSVWLAAGEDYRITGSVDVSGDIHLLFHGARILFDRPANDTYALGFEGNRRGDVADGLRVVNQNQSDWSDTDNSAIRLRECIEAMHEVYEASGFTVGVRVRADDTNCAYNFCWHGGEIKNCRYGLWYNEDDPEGGNPWANSNIFIGGRFIVESGVNESTDRFGVISLTHDNPGLNHVKVHGPSFVLDAGTANARLAWWQGANDGVIWFGNESETEDLVMDADNTSPRTGVWTDLFGADTPSPIPAPIGVNGHSWIDEVFTIDLRRLTDGGAASNIEDMGGMID